MEKEEKKVTKKNNKTLGLMIIFGIAFLILGSFIGFYFGTKMADVTKDDNKNNNVTEEKEEKENTDDEEEVEEEKTEIDSSISQELLKDLEKRADLASLYAFDIMYDKDMFDVGLSNIFAENNQDIYYEIASLVTYDYYVYKSGITPQEWTTKDSSYGPCFEQSQNGYCYVVDKAEMLKYDKTMFNIGEKMLGTFDGYALLKGDKYYITGIPYGPSSLTVNDGETISANMNDDKSIDLVVKYHVEDGYENPEVKDVKYRYTFKLNTNNEYYLYSVYEVE